jgi:protein arginine kinase activator
MKCQNCHKRDATVHLTEIKSGSKHEMHLCESCAASKGLPGKAHFSIQDLLAGIASSQQAGSPKRRTKELQCAACELTISQFQSTGRFGCVDCYTAFQSEILPLIEKIHDSTQHVGKVPGRASPGVALQKEVRHLQLELKRAVKQEDYEKAAQLRDQIKQAEEKLRAQDAPVGSVDAGPLA